MTKPIFVNLRDIEYLEEAARNVELNGPAPGMQNDHGPLVYCSADLSRPGYTYPLTIGETTTRSYIKTRFLEVFDWDQFGELVGGCQKLDRLYIFCAETSVFGPCNLIADTWQLSKDGSGGIIVGQRDDGENGMPLDEYTEAKGTPGVTGEPLEKHPYYKSQKKPVRKIDCFSIQKPCTIDKTIQTGNFKSKAFVSQMVIPTTSKFGPKPALHLQWAARIWR